MAPRVIEPGAADHELVQRYRQGDREAFRHLVINYQKPIYNAAFRVVGRAQDADDVTQAVFLRIVERIDDYDSKFKFFSWIYRIAVNEAIDLLRRNRREDPLDEDSDFEADGSAGPEDRLQARELGDRVQRALMQLKMDDRIVITLRHFSECSYRDISEVLGVDEKTVKSRLFEARQRMAVQLQDLRGVLN
jgi:RNA polymerase sigma-70 factor (ECF subfamily)